MAAESPEKRKMVVPHINLEEVNKSALVSSSPNSPSTLRKSSSVHYNCLCSPTTHAGSFRCRYHRNHGLARSSMSVGSNLSELANVGSNHSEMGSKGSRMCDHQVHAQ
ncbi:serine-rich protein-like protein [Actinidia rufa]|uniref:Serine-rich protein-like protein n=1 Tax=Actinidia rufa TaxID=165716 RepID=A0A7J0GNI0_9ERIC|nr:serine-rich protein-like protein [Actinidia rufa]